MPISPYPRRGYPLAPSLLCRWLDVPISKDLRRTVKGKSTLADLDAGTWNLSPQPDFNALADAVVQRVAGQKSLILARANQLKIPALPPSFKLADLELESRTRNCLQKSGYARDLTALSEASVADLLRSKGFGTKCLVDLLTSIEGNTNDNIDNVSEAPTVAVFRPDPRVIRIAKKIERDRGVGTITRTDPRFGAFVRAIAPGSATLKEALQRLRADARVQRRPDLIGQLRQFQRSLSATRRLVLEEELALIGAGLSARDRDVVFRKLGWDGQGGCTLEEAGHSIGVTRERVRQLIQRFAKQVGSRGRMYLPTLDRVISMIDDLAPSPAAAIEVRLRDEGLTRGQFHVNGVSEAASLLGRSATFVVEQISGVRLVVKEGQETLPERVISTARRITEHWGLGRVTDVTEAVSEKTGDSVSDGLVSAVLLPQKDFEWLDESSGWLWLTGVPRNRVVNQIRKVLSAVSSVPIGELRHGISRPHRMQGFAPPKRVLAEICRRLPECQVVDDVVRRTDRIAEDEDLSPMEAIFARVLRTFGGIAQRPELEEACLQAGVGRPMVWRILSYAAWITKYGIGVYGFRGLNIGPKEIAPMIRKAERQHTNKDYGWKKDGRIWLALQLTAGVINSGVFNTPAGIRPHILGDFEMRDDAGLAIGRLRVAENGSWGLLRLFSRRGGEPGDVLLLTFDLSSRQAEARLGGNDLFDQAGTSDEQPDE